MGRGSEVGCYRGELAAEMVDVVGVWGMSEKLVDDWSDVVECGDGGERIAGSEDSASGGQQKGGGDNAERDSSIIEAAGERAIGATSVACGPGHAPVQPENALDSDVS